MNLIYSVFSPVQTPDYALRESPAAGPPGRSSLPIRHQAEGSNPPHTNMNSTKLVTSCPTQAVGTSDNSRGANSNGGVTAGNPLVGKGAAGTIGSQTCETPLLRASPGAPEETTVSQRSQQGCPRSTASTRDWGNPRNEAVAAACALNSRDSVMPLKNRTFQIGMWNTRGKTLYQPGCAPVDKVSIAKDIMSVEGIDLLVLTKTHTDKLRPIVTL